MSGKNLSNMTQLTRVNAAAASAGTAIDTASVDMLGWYGVLFFGVIATANPGNFAHAAQSDDDATFADLAATKVAPAANGNSFLIDVYRPMKRFVRCELDSRWRKHRRRRHLRPPVRQPARPAWNPRRHGRSRSQA